MVPLWIKTCKKTWMAAALFICWTMWKERNSLAFDDVNLSAKMMEISFVYNLWSFSKMHIDLSSCSLVSFFD